MEFLIYFSFIVNIFLIGYVAYRENRFHITSSKSDNDIILGINIMWNRYPVRKGINAKGLFYIPIRNAKKIILKEYIESVKNDKYNQKQRLNAKLSWLKTKEEVEEFRKDYSCVNKNFVDTIVNEKLLQLSEQSMEDVDIGEVQYDEYLNPMM